MIKNQKWRVLISSVVILLPMLAGLLIWNQLPATMTSHWGADGVADGAMPKAFMVFGTPLILLAVHLLLMWASLALEKNKNQNNKIMNICYSIIPALSIIIHAFVYSIALEKEWNMFALLPVFIGVLFMVIGNYMPKTTRNRTAGIKLRWTMGNDENWQKTHRVGGKIYFFCGLAVMATAMLPIKYTIAVLIAMIAVSVIVPTAYSYSIYKKHMAEGVEYEPVFDKNSDKIAIRITQIFVPLILAGVAVLMCTGNIEVFYGDTNFQIVASYAEDITVNYEDIESVEYRETFDIGYREVGFGSPRLSMGTFKNEEFGRYTIYAYTRGEGAVVLRQGDRVLVIVGKTAEDTKLIYDALAEKIN